MRPPKMKTHWGDGPNALGETKHFDDFKRQLNQIRDVAQVVLVACILQSEAMLLAIGGAA